ELSEGVLGAQRHRFGSVPSPPLTPVADHDAALRAPVARVDLLEAGGADERPRVLQHDVPDDAPGVVRGLLEVVLALPRARRIARAEEPGDPRVREPALEGRRVLGARRDQPDAGAFDHRAKHRMLTVS